MPSNSLPLNAPADGGKQEAALRPYAAPEVAVLTTAPTPEDQELKRRGWAGDSVRSGGSEAPEKRGLSAYLRRRRDAGLSVRTTLLLSTFVFVGGGIAFVWGISYYFSSRNTEELVSRALGVMVLRAQSYVIDRLITPAELLANASVLNYRFGFASEADATTMLRRWYGDMLDHPSVATIALGLDRYWGVRRDVPGNDGIYFLTPNPGDPLERDYRSVDPATHAPGPVYSRQANYTVWERAWFRTVAAGAPGVPRWTAVYAGSAYAATGSRYVTVGVPLHGFGGLAAGASPALPAGLHGVLAVDLEVRRLLEFFQSSTARLLTPNALLFAADDEGQMIAVSRVQDAARVADLPLEGPMAADRARSAFEWRLPGEELVADTSGQSLLAGTNPHPLIRACWKYGHAVVEEGRAQGAGAAAGPVVTSFTLGGTRYFLGRGEILAEGIHWHLFAAVPEGDVLGLVVRSNIASAAANAAFLLAALVVSALLSLRITRPLRLLRDTMASITRQMQEDPAEAKRGPPSLAGSEPPAGDCSGSELSEEGEGRPAKGAAEGGPPVRLRSGFAGMAGLYASVGGSPAPPPPEPASATPPPEPASPPPPARRAPSPVGSGRSSPTASSPPPPLAVGKAASPPPPLLATAEAGGSARGLWLSLDTGSPTDRPQPRRPAPPPALDLRRRAAGGRIPSDASAAAVPSSTLLGNTLKRARIVPEEAAEGPPPEGEEEPLELAARGAVISWTPMQPPRGRPGHGRRPAPDPEAAPPPGRASPGGRGSPVASPQRESLVERDSWHYQSALTTEQRLAPGLRAMPRSWLAEIRGLQGTFQTLSRTVLSFMKFVPNSVVRSLLRQEDSARLGMEVRYMTVMFVDIQDFTHITERMNLHKLVVLITEYFEAVTTVMEEHRATVDKYIGDALMLLWNAPMAVADHEAQACAAALACKRRLKELRHHFRSIGLPPLRSRFGIHAGECLVGNVGSQSRMNYTAVGDAVNLAARCESLNKMYGSSICITGDVYEKAGGPPAPPAPRDGRQVKERFVCRWLDRAVVKGKSQPTDVYELVCAAGEPLSPKRMQMFADHGRAMAMLVERRLDEARDLFAAVLRAYPHDRPARMLLDRVVGYISAPSTFREAHAWREK